MRWMLVVALALGAAPAWAQEQEDACAQVARTARALMTARQSGLEAEKAMEPVLKMPEGRRDAGRDLVLSAYAQPRWTSDGARKRAVEDFGNNWYMTCMGMEE